jgi:hypothetical protein
METALRTIRTAAAIFLLRDIWIVEACGPEVDDKVEFGRRLYHNGFSVARQSG